jgi:hypothetical protein
VLEDFIKDTDIADGRGMGDKGKKRYSATQSRIA